MIFKLEQWTGRLNDRLKSLAKTPLQARLAHGAIWGFAGSVMARGLALASSFFVARLLGRSGFGEWGIIQYTVGMVGTLGGFGLGLTATKYIAELKNTDPPRIGRIIALSSLVTVSLSAGAALLLWLSAPWVAARVLDAPHLGAALRIGAFLLVFSAADEAQKGTLSGFEEFRLMARIVLWTGILAFPMTIAGVYWGGLKGGIWALVFNSFLSWSFNFISIRRIVKNKGMSLSYRDCWTERSMLWSFSLPAFLSQSLVIPVNWACSAILANQTSGYRELGLFNAANQWRGALLFIPYAAGRIILPVMSDLYASGDAPGLKRVFRGLGNAYLVAAGIGFIAISALSPVILKGYGPEFRGGEKVVIALAFSGFCSANLFVINQFLFSTKRIWFSLASNVLLAVISLGLAFVLIPKMGALGLAISLAIGSTCEIVWKLMFLKGRGMI